MKIRMQKKGPNIAFFFFEKEVHFTDLNKSSAGRQNFNFWKTSIGIRQITGVPPLFSVFFILLVGPIKQFETQKIRISILDHARSTF